MSTAILGTSPSPSPVANVPDLSSEGERRFAIDNLGWSGYQTLLDLFGDDGPRMYYLNGTVELMTVGFSHESRKKVLARMVEALTEELDIPIRAAGSATLKRESVERGAEPDESYYVANAERVGGATEMDLEVIPPPDLVIEVEITSPLLDKLSLYGGLGVSEIWRHGRQGLTILLLQPDGSYVGSTQSRAFPFLPMVGFAQQLQDYDPANETRWIRAFRAWVREVVAPLHQP